MGVSVNRECVNSDQRQRMNVCYWGAVEWGWVLEDNRPRNATRKEMGRLGANLKPSHEPIIMARKPLAGTVAENVERWGTGALNIDGCRIEVTRRGRR